ncbi:MAG: hypothetical protein HN607_00325 [Verrucomicrobia bacterium]|nr:hypothetical protein [Verrucomicrobiota bacterium]
MQLAEIHSGHWLFYFKSVWEYIEREYRTRPPLAKRNWNGRNEPSAIFSFNDPPAVVIIAAAT